MLTRLPAFDFSRIPHLRPTDGKTSECDGWCFAKPSISPAVTIDPTTPTADMNFCLNADFQRINRTVCALRTGGYYYEGLTSQQATELLRTASIGSFLVRDSSDPRFLFALSVQTDAGPTSIRIHYVQGQFRLDAEENITSAMPLFDCVVHLVEYYVRLSQSVKGSSCVWVDGSGRKKLPCRLFRPHYKAVPSLQHLCRLTINEHLQEVTSMDRLELPTGVKAFLREYPHRC